MYVKKRKLLAMAPRYSENNCLRTECDRLRAERNRLMHENTRLRAERNKYRYFYKKKSKELIDKADQKKDTERSQLKHENIVNELEECHQELGEVLQELGQVLKHSEKADRQLNGQVDILRIDDAFVLTLTDSNLKSMSVAIKRNQLVKFVKFTGGLYYFKFVFVETSDGQFMFSSDVIVSDTVKRNGVHRKHRQLGASKATLEMYIQKWTLAGLPKSFVQNKWNNTICFRWGAGFGRKGDLRAKLSSDFLSSAHLYDEELSTALVQRLQKIRGFLIRDRRGTVCLYCGGAATEDDHYMSRVRDGSINKYLDCEVNLVPSCATCHRGSGKDTKGSEEDPLVWWLDERQTYRTKHKNHPQNKIVPELKEQVEQRLRCFDTFFKKYAPKLPEDYHKSSKDCIEGVLDNTWSCLMEELLKFDLKDRERFDGLTLIHDMNERFRLENPSNRL